MMKNEDYEFLIYKPSSKTDLTINVADLTAKEIAERLQVISALILDVRDGVGVNDGDYTYVIGFEGEQPYINGSFDHQEWDDDDNYCSECLMFSRQYEEGSTIYAMPRDLAEWFKTDKTCCEYFRER